jgi:hypothetical protein
VKKNKKYPVLATLVLVSFFLCVLGIFGHSQQNEKVDPGLLDELIGPYRVEIQGQKGAFIFIKEKGILKGAPAGEEPAELLLKEGEEMTFVGHTPDGTEQFFKFLRNEDGKIGKCILSIPSAGLVVEMFKMEE